jgi:hypothetical protein
VEGCSSITADSVRTHERDMDGNVCALMFLDVATYMLWLCPLKNKGGAEAARAVGAYREHVRAVFKGELLPAFALRQRPELRRQRSGGGTRRVRPSEVTHGLAAPRRPHLLAAVLPGHESC